MIIDNITHHIETLISQLKKDPMNLNARLALIQCYCLEADWQKALNTTDNFLKIHNDPHVKSLLKQNILCEIQRDEVFKNTKAPLAYPDTAFHDNQTLLLQAFYGDNDNIVDIFSQLIDECDFWATIATYDEQNYQDSWIDSDFRLSSVFEIFVDAHYYWLPANNIRSIHFWRHEVLTDILWRRAKITLQNQQEISAFIPARYPILTEVSEDIKQNKRTQWEQISKLSWANGQKTLTSGDVDIPLLDIDVITRG
ncbi:MULTISPECIES: type VI secretion system accessory protein TagJ [Moraxella]|uniref:Protein of avirulence locus involved in temperature-dependent protein secretion n=1 Tax=Moraxella lacunata TaxID=477 RepID=A0A1B8PV80_MORLA|nr:MULTISPECIES: type VI secretion system accessory protein TagJ [Moraxella]MBE9578304.1 hypothetical protein [Moraxella sp. K1664]MBE9589230.1 hypothetical protein [Moraxella sp. K1630]MBE9589382.1 hypothetical protein [Moraxella sp. K127]MBE9597491.1 hypothetical protein [Moraxella sp. K2450]MDH9219879.1 type VI secretion system accessory protein TagJ [Moraxella lacunata]